MDTPGRMENKHQITIYISLHDKIFDFHINLSEVHYHHCCVPSHFSTCSFLFSVKDQNNLNGVELIERMVIYWRFSLSCQSVNCIHSLNFHMLVNLMPTPLYRKRKLQFKISLESSYAHIMCAINTFYSIFIELTREKKIQ